jgi:hypothetical protein
MIILTIGDTSRRLSSSAGVEEGWVTHHLRTDRPDATPPGVHVRIAGPSVALNLSAGETTLGAVTSRSLRPAEAQVVELWRARGLDRPGFRSGQLVAFLHQLHDVLEQGSAALPTGMAIRGVSGHALWPARR